MKTEFGKWLMDIAKYMVTGLLLSTIFVDMNEPIIVYMVVILSITVLVVGLVTTTRLAFKCEPYLFLCYF